MLCRLLSSSREEWVLKLPIGSHDEGLSEWEFDVKNGRLAEAGMQRLAGWGSVHRCLDAVERG